jgi:hypothetical protein
LSSRPEACVFPSCHLDRRPASSLLVISTGGRRPQWRDLAANESCPALAPRSMGRAGTPSGRGVRPGTKLRQIRGQMSRLRCASLDMTRGENASLDTTRGENASLDMTRGENASLDTTRGENASLGMTRGRPAARRPSGPWPFDMTARARVLPNPCHVFSRCELHPRAAHWSYILLGSVGAGAGAGVGAGVVG